MWAKVLGIVSLIFLALVIILAIDTVGGVNSGEYDAMALLVIPIFLLPVGLGIIGMWALGFLTAHLKKIKKNKIAIIINAIGLIVFLAWFLIIFLKDLIQPSPIRQGYLLEVSTVYAMLIIPVIYFAIALGLSTRKPRIIKKKK